MSVSRNLGDATSWTDDLDQRRWLSNFFNVGRDEVRRFLSRKNTIPNASAVVVRADVLQQVGNISGSYRLCGDWDLWVRVLLRSDLTFVAEKLNYWRQNSSNVRTVPAGILEAEEGDKILQFIGQNLNLSDQEIGRMLASFRRRCLDWQSASAR